MRKVIAGVMMSLDGVMQAPGGPEEDPTGDFSFGGWVFPHFDEVLGQAMDNSFSAPFDLLLGRKTYEIFAAHWPHAGADDPIARRFNEVTKYVATRSSAPLTWQNSVALSDAARDIARLKQEDGPVLLTQGSSELLQSLLNANLIDEFRLSIFPVILGAGKRLFGKGTIPAGLKLTQSIVSTTGVTINTYVPTGSVQTGSFALEKPSKEESERRERLKKES
jgi:dihydrofolate reductase